jgi:glutamate racemase
VIGLFDSGLGGLTVVRRVRARLPHASMLFYADQAHVPYGDRTAEDLLGLLRHNLRWIDERGADAIVMACNTSCAIADAYGWPAVRAPVLDLIDAAAFSAARTHCKRIGVIATTATARSGAYGRRLRAAIADAEVYEVSAPALVPLVEAGTLEGDVARRAVAEACAQLPRTVDAVVFGCTHYPLLDEQFAKVLGSSVIRIDPAIEQAERVAALIESQGGSAEDGSTRYVTSGDLVAFRGNVARMMGESDPSVMQVAAEELPLR